MVTWGVSTGWPRAVVVAAVLGLSFCTGPSLGAACRPPGNLFVCQDRYGAEGRAFLSWTLGEMDYTAVRVYLDDQLEGEGPGDARSGYVTEIPPGLHTFTVEGVCADGSVARTSKAFEVLSVTPYTQPVSAIDCLFDAAAKQFRVTWTSGPSEPLFIDVYFRRTGTASFRYVTTLPGDATRLVVDNALEDDTVRLQFFNAQCYGSELVGCPGPTCEPPTLLRACQDLYGASPRVFVDWLQSPSVYTGFQLFVDGELRATVGAEVGLIYFDDIALGTHRFGIRGVCGAEVTALEELVLEVLAETPHPEPAVNLRCERDAAAEELTATWLPGQRPSEFIDLYLRHPGQGLLEFVGTIAGDSTRVRVRRVGAGDELVLQFFDQTCHGSPLLTCSEVPGADTFRRGDADGSAVIDLTDAVFVLRFLFLGDDAPLCRDAADANDDSRLDIADAIFVLSWLFGGGRPPPAPGPATCGEDPTADAFPACLTAACE